MNVLIIEDDAIWRSKLQVILDELNIAIAAIVSNVSDALLFLQKQQPTLIIADILLGQERVFKLFELDSNFAQIPVILITQSDKEIYYNEAKKLPRYSYIIKPVQKLTLRSAIDNLLQLNTNHSPAETKALQFKSKYNTKISLPFQNILYIEQEKHYCHIYCTHRKEILKKSLTALIQELDESFLRIHRSICVNTNFIDNFTAGLTALKIRGNQLPIGRINREEVKKYIAQQYLKSANTTKP